MSKMKDLYSTILTMLEQGDSPIDRAYISEHVGVPLAWVNEVADELAKEARLKWEQEFEDDEMANG